MVVIVMTGEECIKVVVGPFADDNAAHEFFEKDSKLKMENNAYQGLIIAKVIPPEEWSSKT